MSHARQSDINVSHFDRMVQRVDEAYEYYKADGKIISNVFLIPIVKNEKKPDAPRVYETGDDGKDTVARGTRLTPEEARRRIQNGGNVGIDVIIDLPRTSQNRHKYSLTLLDFDVKDRKTLVPEEKIVEFINRLNLFAYRTRNGGYRVVVVNDGRFDNGQIGYENKVAGDILAWKKYTLAPGCYTPSDENGTPDATGYYDIYNDAPIRVIENADLPEWFQFRDDLTPVQKHNIRTGAAKVSLTDIDPTENKKWISEFKFSVDDVRGMSEELDELLEGPTGGRWGNRSQADFAVIGHLYFYGFSPQQIAEILRYYRPYEKTMREDYLALSIAKLMGGKRWVSPVDKARKLPVIIEGVEVEEVEKLPDELPLDKLINMIIGPPRAGKSRWGLTLISHRGGGNYVAPNHTIIEQQFNTLKAIAPHLTSVWLAGKDRCCARRNESGEKMDCNNCEYKPVKAYRAGDDVGDRMTERSYEEYAKRALDRLGQLRHEEIEIEYFGVCPYYLLHFAEKQADVCFTVPHFICSTDQITKVTPRAIMILDEDTTFRHFLPTSIELIEFGKFKNGGTTIRPHVKDILRHLQGLVDYIESKDRMPEWDRVMMEIVESYRRMDEIFTEFEDNPSLNAATTAEAKENLAQRIRGIDMIYLKDTTREERFKVLEKLTEYERDLHSEGIVPFFEPMLFPYKDDPLVWIGANPGRLFLVGDQMQIIRRPCESDQYVMIGFTESRLFARTFVEDLVDRSPHLHNIEPVKKPRIALWSRGPPDETQQQLDLKFSRRFKSAKEMGKETTAPHRAFQADLGFTKASTGLMKEWRLTSFPYGENFNIFKFIGSIKAQNHMMWQLLRLLVENNTSGNWKVPALVLTSSKDHQLRLWESLGKSGEVHMTRIEEIDRTKQIRSLGMLSIFYQNSTISRGVDVPWHDILFVHSTSFAQPYWSARLQYYSDLKNGLAVLMGRKGSVEMDEVSFYLKFQHLKTKMSQSEVEDQFRLAEKEFNWTKEIQSSLLSDETTNGALRMSPVPGYGPRHQKVLIVRDHDFALVNPMITDSMRTIDIKDGTDLNLLLLEISKISKTTNPSAMFKLLDNNWNLENAKCLRSTYSEKISREDLVSDGLSVGDPNPDLEILISRIAELKQEVDQGVESIMDYLYRNLLNTNEYARSEKKIIQWYRTHASKSRSSVPTADIVASLRKLEKAGYVTREERKDGKIMYKSTRKDFVKPPAVREPLAEQKPKMSAKVDGDPEW